MKQTYEIKNRYTSEVLFSYELQEGQEIKWLARHAVEAAVASNTDLHGANLEGAYLEGAYLRGAYLEGANLEGAYLEGANLRGAYLEGANLEGAYLEGANLRGADLRYVNLWRANLQGAYLEDAIGDMKYFKSMQFDTWSIVYTSTHLSIGCQSHPIDVWQDWKNKREWIEDMADDALEWAEKYLDLVLQIIELSPTTPTS